MEGISFGTDGWRGVIGWDFTAERVRACALGVASYLKSTDMASRGLVLGYDTRFGSKDFASEVAQVITSKGIPTFFSVSSVPTPVVSYSILHLRAGGGVVITASHNPPEWNGFKYKPDYAGSASPEIVKILEEKISVALQSQISSKPLVEGRKEGLLIDIDFAPPYITHLRKLVDIPSLQGSGLKMVVDTMYGSGIGYFPQILDGMCGINEIHAEENPLFPGISQPEPVAHNLKALSCTILETRADVGIALDGDADRLGIVDEKGHYISTTQIFALLSLYCLEVREQRGPLVKSVTMSSMIDHLGKLFNVPVYETPVGFKYIGPTMMNNDAIAGGEESGGYSFKGHIPERDGILSGLYFLDMMVKTGKTPSELVEYLFSIVGPHYYDRFDIPFHSDMRSDILHRVSTQRPDTIGGSRVLERDEIDGVRFHLEGGSWGMIRFSGTEPLLRIYAEAGSLNDVRVVLEDLRSLVGI